MIVHHYALFYRSPEFTHAKWGPQFSYGFEVYKSSELLRTTADINKALLASIPIDAELTGISYLGSDTEVDREQVES